MKKFVIFSIFSNKNQNFQKFSAFFKTFLTKSQKAYFSSTKTSFFRFFTFCDFLKPLLENSSFSTQPIRPLSEVPDGQFRVFQVLPNSQKGVFSKQGSWFGPFCDHLESVTFQSFSVWNHFSKNWKIALFFQKMQFSTILFGGDWGGPFWQ